MFSKLVECVPNFSEGRQIDVIRQIVASINSVDGVIVLNYSLDEDHNRSVVTFVGHPDNIGEAAFRAISKAKELININKHTGEHPRVGATDVCPFVPLHNTTMEECIEIARKLAQRVSEELEIPTYLYEEASTCEKRKKLENIRKCQLERLREYIGKDTEYKPDFGPTEVHPTAGATCIGARFFLIAYNVNLKTTDLQVAKKIAHEIRERDGGLRGIKALGFSLNHKNMVQVSMNITDYRQTSMTQVFDKICDEAQKHGIEVAESEIIGLVPEDAILESSIRKLKLNNFSKQQIIENSLQTVTEELGVYSFLDRLSSNSPTPGGGSACALTATTAASLAIMVTSIAIGKKKTNLTLLQEAKDRLTKLQLHLVKTISEDSMAYRSYIDAKKMPRNTEDEQKIYRNVMDNAIIKCTLVPLDIAITSYKVLQEIPFLVENTIKSTVSDLGICCSQIASAIEGSYFTIKSNLSMVKDVSFKSEVEKEILSVMAKAEETKSELLKKIQTMI